MNFSLREVGLAEQWLNSVVHSLGVESFQTTSFVGVSVIASLSTSSLLSDVWVSVRRHAPPRRALYR